MRTSKFLGLEFADNGQRRLTGTASSAAGEVFCSFTALAATVVSYDCVCATGKGDASQSSLPVPAGVTIFGPCENIVMTSGDIMAYLAE